MPSTAPTPTPIPMLVFTLACAVVAVLPIGYVGFIPYGILVWLRSSG